MIVNVETLAEFFGKTARRIQQWADEDGMPKDSRGKYDLEECAKWRIKKLEEEIDIVRNSGDEKLYDLKMDNQRLSNIERELKLRRLMGELVESEAVRIAWTNETKNFRKGLKALKTKLINGLAGIDDENKKREIIQREIDMISNFMAELKVESEFDNDELLNELV